MTRLMHLDEAREVLLDTLRNLLSKEAGVRAILVEDIFGKSHVQINFIEEKKKSSRIDPQEKVSSGLNKVLGKSVGSFWSGDVHITKKDGDSPEDSYFEALWNDAYPDQNAESLRILSRARTRGGWIAKPVLEPPWTCVKPSPKSPGIIAFFSYKGGVGRSTALAAFAIQRARIGEKVCVLDCDLDAPGIGSLFSGSEFLKTTKWGVVDALIEENLIRAPLTDYCFSYMNSANPLKGELQVFPAGEIDEHYLSKLSRIDFEPPFDPGQPNPIHKLVSRIGGEIQPHWILLDVRAGLSEITGVIFSGLAHLNILFSTASGQSIDGLKVFVERLGKARLQNGKSSQGNCIVVHSMIPRNPSVAQEFKTRFEGAALNLFESGYYLPDPIEGSSEDISVYKKQIEQKNEPWTLGDMESALAPHKPISISYDEKLAGLISLAAVETELTSGEYKVFGNRVTSFFKVDE